MNKYALIGLLSIPALGFADPLAQGILAFQQRQWNDAMEQFIQVLRVDPTNKQAHAYINLLARELELSRRRQVQDTRLRMLEDTARRLEARNQDSTSLRAAMADTTQADQRAREDHWQARLEEARNERQLGHLLAANDLVLGILIEQPAHPAAQRELSELQSALRVALDRAGGASVEERYALEGFYAFGQADYAKAVASWKKVEAVVAQTYAPSEQTKRLKAFHFQTYHPIAQAHVDEEQVQERKRLAFRHGVELYDKGRYEEALSALRQLAISDPEYPQLGFYLVQAEAAAEKDRARRLGEQKRQQVAKWLETGVAELEKEKYAQAEQTFQRVLAADPTHPQATAYLAMVRAEMKRRHDPKAAQLHYEAGLVSYASGKLEDAIREWRIATRMDANNEKAANALVKAQKEIALYRDALPGEP